jgi:hypothetical protein
VGEHSVCVHLHDIKDESDIETLHCECRIVQSDEYRQIKIPHHRRRESVSIVFRCKSKDQILPQRSRQHTQRLLTWSRNSNSSRASLKLTSRPPSAFDTCFISRLYFSLSLSKSRAQKTTNEKANAEAQPKRNPAVKPRIQDMYHNQNSITVASTTAKTAMPHAAIEEKSISENVQPRSGRG